ncbi:hypothetical protein SAMN06295888_102256 [Desulfonatronum zhilinae]|nr:hypothetical protein SAMN06295888_102256 [Desulfonatronum zhilinae]
MQEIHEILGSIHLWLDAFLISAFRLLSNPVSGFFFGTFILTVWCTLVGELTSLGVGRMNRKYIKKLEQESIRLHNLSVKAIIHKDKESYRACNKMANEAWGKYFFATISQGAASVWPVPFALAWMHTRFAAVEFELAYPIPLLPEVVGYPAVFIPMYILVRICFAKLKPWLPFFHGDDAPKLRRPGQEEEKMITWADVDKHKGLPG